MAAIRDSSRRSLHRHLHPPASSSRYAAFDGSTESDRRSKSTSSFSNKWEIALVTIIVAAGIVITTIAAIKAHEKSEDGDLIKAANELDIRSNSNKTHNHKMPKYHDKKKGKVSSTTEATLSTAPHLIPGNYFPTTNSYPNHNQNHVTTQSGSGSVGFAGIRVQVPTEPDLPEMIETTDRPVAVVKGIEVSRPDPIIPTTNIDHNRQKVDFNNDFNGKLFFDDSYANFYAPDYETSASAPSDYQDPMTKFRHQNQQPSVAASENVDSRTMLSGQSVQEIRDPIASSESIQPNGGTLMTSSVHDTNGNSNQQFIGSGGNAHDGLPGFPPPRGSFINSDHSRTAELAADGAGFIIEDHPPSLGSFMDGSSHVLDRTPKTRYHHNQHHPRQDEGGDARNSNNNNNRFSARLESKDPQHHHHHRHHPHAITSSAGHQQSINHDNNNNNNQASRSGSFGNNQFPVYSPSSSSSSSQSSNVGGVGQASPSSPVLQKLPVFITASDNNDNNQGSVHHDNNQQQQNYGSGYTRGAGNQQFYHQLSQPSPAQGSSSQQQQLASLPQIPLGMPIAGLLMASNSNYNQPQPVDNQFNTHHSAPPQSASSNLMSASLAQSTSSNLPGITPFAKPSSPASGSLPEKLSAAAHSIAASFIPPSLFPRRLGHLLPASLFNPAANYNNQRIDNLPTLTHENYANRYKRSTFYDVKEINSNHYPINRIGNNSNTDAKVKEMTASESGYYDFDDENFRANIPPPLFDNSFDSGSPSTNRRGSSRRRGRARSISRNAYGSGEESSSHKKSSYGILGSGNFEVIRGGIYGDEGGESSESYRSHRNHPPPSLPSLDDYDDSSSSRKRYSYGAASSSDADDTDYFGPKDPVLGFQGYDNFQLASNQEEDKSDLDKSASVPMIKAVHHQSPPSALPLSGRSNSYASHTGTVMLDSDQDLMADS